MKRSSEEMYEVMVKAIAYLRTHAKGQPGAGEVAKAIGMSTSHFEHMFAQWVGTTPKRFLAHITKERAKHMLVESKNSARTAQKAGLSGANKLYELLVTYEAVSPGELKKGEIDITYGIHPSPFGWCVIGITKRGICALSFIDKESERKAVANIREGWPRATLTRDDKKTEKYAKQIFAQKKKPVHLLVKGTNFQIKVWEALMRIPEGMVTDYSAIAKAIGTPKAVRAVGSACGKNNIAYLIPCHRVLAADGGLGGYHWGLERKAVMLNREAVS